MPSKERYNKRRSLGLCVTCGVSQAVTAVCESCKRKAKEKHHRRKKDGLCTKCGAVAVGGLIYCLTCQQKNRDRCKVYAREHSSERVAYVKRYRERNGRNAKSENATPNARKRKNKWSKNNPEKVKVIRQKRRARLYDAEGHFGPKQLEARFALWGNCCYMCGSPANVIEHVIPLARGGTNWPANLRPACTACNASKGVSIAESYRAPNFGR